MVNTFIGGSKLGNISGINNFDYNFLSLSGIKNNYAK